MPRHGKSLEISKEEKSHDRRCDKHCETVRVNKVVPIQGPHQQRVKVKKVLDCDNVKCHDCIVNKKLCPIHVKQRNLNVHIRQENQCLPGDEISVYLKKPKAKCEVPKVRVNVLQPEVVLKPQRVNIEFEKGSIEKGKPRVRVHCPEPECYVLKPKVCVEVEKPGKVCVPEPIITFRCVEKRDKCHDKSDKYRDNKHESSEDSNESTDEY